MGISYNKLFHMLIDRDMKKGELQEKAGITGSIMARLAKNQTVKTETIEKICKALDCQPGDIMEYIPDRPSKEVLADIKKAVFEETEHDEEYIAGGIIGMAKGAIKESMKLSKEYYHSKKNEK